jgi:hypothetical protein
MNSLEVTDNESKAVQKTPNRVALADIEANIIGEFYMSGDAVVPDATTSTMNNLISIKNLSLLSVCFIVLKNGFTVIGKSAPADEANFNRALGHKFAREDAIRQIWPLMGYALRDRLMGDAK